MKKTTQKPKDKYFSINFRVTELERQRIDQMIGLLQETNGFLRDADIYKELMSLTNRGLITADMREWLANPTSTGDQFRIDKVRKRESHQSAAEKKKA